MEIILHFSGLGSAFLAAVELGKAGEGAVVAFFYFGGKDAGGELVVFEVVGDALAALALAGAGFIGAGAGGFVGFEVAFHKIDSLVFKGVFPTSPLC
jgi:hypothetical protein